MTKTIKKSPNSPLRTRLLPFFIWCSLGAVAFYWIAISGYEEKLQQQSWPLYKAKVLSSDIHWVKNSTAGEYQLAITLGITPERGASYTANLFQVGPKGALEKRIQNQFSPGKFVEVRSNPKKPSDIKLNISATWGPFIVGGIISVFFFLCGFSVLFNHSDEKSHSE